MFVCNADRAGVRAGRRATGPDARAIGVEEGSRWRR
jgi:hypothetical protein